MLRYWHVGIIGLLLGLGSSVDAQECAWTNWAAPWTSLNLGADANPPNQQFPANNWDYTLSQSVDGGVTTLDVPTGGGTSAFHWFLGPQSPDFPGDKAGSGGIYQEITVTPGVPIEYSYYWKSSTSGAVTWNEFLLVDGPFTIEDADTNADPNIKRKRVDTSYGWQQITDASPLFIGPGGATLTPTGTTVTVILKGGRAAPSGRMELFFDNVVVSQGGGPNLLTNGDFEDGTQGTTCDDTLVEQDSNQGNYWISVSLGECTDQHTVTSVDPITLDTGDARTLTINGTDLENVTEVQLIPAGGEGFIPTIVSTGVTVGPGPGETSLQADMPVGGAHHGIYDVRTIQDLPCLNQTLPAAVTLTCPDPSPITNVSPASVTDPIGLVELTLSGPNVTALTEVTLRLGDSQDIFFTDATPTIDGSDIRVSFDLSCAPAGTYQVTGCGLDRNFTIFKSSPAQVCHWQPWTAAWSKINFGPDGDLDPPNEIYDSPNWDYDLSQATNLNLPRDTPAGGGANALHWFLDTQPSETAISNGWGSGGFYQEFTVTPGVPIEYSFDWKGKCLEAVNWYEVLLIDGPYSVWDADGFPESATANNPYMVRKREFENASFGWEEITHLTAADVGPAGTRPQTITPTGNVATLVFKAGHTPTGDDGATELFIDNVVVTQNAGPNLIVNGDMESSNQINICNSETVFQDPCEDDFWVRSDFVIVPPLVCNAPFADADGDGDVDADDFAVFQLCVTGDSGGTPIPSEPEYCGCFDRDLNEMIGAADFSEFANCATGPEVLHASNPNPLCSEQP